MKDLFKNYHRHKALVNIGILSLSVVLAIGINAFVISDEMSQSLKASVVDISASKTSGPDLSLGLVDDTIEFTLNTTIEQAKEISFSLTYNPELITLGELSSDLAGSTLSLIENTPGYSTVIISLDNSVEIDSGISIANVNFDRHSEDTIHLNPLNVNFTESSDEKFLLTTQGLVF